MKISNDIQLVSLHIPKTAGTAFRTVLQDQVGKKHLAKLDVFPSGLVQVNNKNFTKASLSKKITTIHGHFQFKDLQKNLELGPHVKYITWLREPLDRVLSNYNFLNKIIADRLKEKPEENLMARMAKTLKEFAALEENQNVMSRFLEGADLSKFSFIGIQNQFESELRRLEKIMAWPSIENRKHNVTGNQNVDVDSETLEFIKSVNEKDVELFERALMLGQNAN